MENIKIGDVVAYRSDSTVSEIIRKITNSNYSHVAIVVSPTQIIEGDGYTGHVRYRNILEYKNHLDIYTLDFLTDEQRIGIASYMESKVGLKYDRLLLLWLFIKYTLHIRLPYKNDKKVICSEICNHAYRSIGIGLAKKRFPVPDDVLKKLRLSGNY
ncbi:MAG TPA: hypothetical protein DEG71_01730 [Clostridiales bacterium]|nr:hypothetical protein [Clostridiales bacterium]